MVDVLCVAGPTCCGKTKMGVLLAQRLNGEVVSVDSMQIYRGLSIATAAPTEEEREGIPHYMVGVASPAENWSVARYAQEARACVEDIRRRGKRPILVGGSGLYLDAVLSGETFAPGAAGGAVRAELAQTLAEQGAVPLRAELARVDPEAWARIHPADTKRLLRALEVYRETGKPLSQFQQESRQRPPLYRAATIGLGYQERAELYDAIDRRVEAMAAAGLLEEVRALAAQNPPPGATVWQAIGCKELLPVLAGDRTLAEGLAEIKLHSRQYAKRQLTWLRRKEGIHWILWEKKRNYAAALQNATKYLAALGLQ